MAFDIGVDIGGTNIKLGVVDAQGRLVRRRLLPTRAKQGPVQALERVAAVVEGFRRGCKVASVGVGIAGLVDHEHGIVRVPPNLPGWNGTPVGEMLSRLVGLPIHCANDVNAVTLGEWLHGAGRGCADLLCVTLGTGVGGGIVSSGRLLLGANHAAGEIGHVIIHGNGLECRCGNSGCVERYVGAAWVIERTRKRIRAQVKRLRDHKNQTTLFGAGQNDGPSLILELAGDYAHITMREIGHAARKGDRLACGIVEEMAEQLGLAVAGAVQLVDPELVIVGGGVSGLGSPLLRALRRVVYHRVPMFPGRKLNVVRAALGNDAGVVGASRLSRLRPGRA